MLRRAASMAASRNPYPACGSVQTAATGDVLAAPAREDDIKGTTSVESATKVTSTRLTTTRLLANETARELDDDIEVTQVPRVLLEEMKEDSLEGRLRLATPPRARLTDRRKIVRSNDDFALFALGSQRFDHRVGRLIGVDEPAIVALISPGILYGHPLETPHQPSMLDKGEVFNEF